MSATPRWFTVLVIVSLAGLTAANTLRPAFDPDTWWHLRIGRWIHEHRTVPETDPISRIGIEESRPWQAYSWLYEWILERCLANGGTVGILWFRTTIAGLSTATLVMLLLVRHGATFRSFAILFGISCTILPMATERPWHVTIAWTAITIVSVQRIRNDGRLRTGLGLVPLFALWANLHIQFVLGLAVLALATIAPGRAKRSRFVLLLLACTAATLVNPYHLRLYLVIWDYATQAAPRSIIHELTPPELFKLWTLACSTLLASAIVQQIGLRNRDLFNWGLILLGGILASRMNRDLWLGAFCAAMVIRPAAHGPVHAIRLGLVVFGIYILLRVGNLLGWIGEHDTSAAHERIYPVRAAEFIRKSMPPGPMFNDISWGGYLAWELPEYPVTIDGRTNFYGNDRLLQSFRTWSTSDGWKDDFELSHCRLIVANRSRPFTAVLREQPAWALAYEDEIAAVFVRECASE